MDLNPAVCYRAVQARDARYHGRFFTCVKTTGIYCRPICPARPPKFENCQFVPTAAAAQEAAFRPCLRCRPESSPTLHAWQGTAATVSRALKLIETGALDEGNVAALAERLGLGERQLRRLFSRHLGAAPITVAQTRRVLLAKQLIHQTDLSMIDVALASGFGSVRRFNEAFQRLYQRPPSKLRNRTGTSPASPEITLLLPYRPPYDWESMLRFLRVRAIAGLEIVTADTYSRAIALEDVVGSLQVRNSPEHASLEVTIRVPRLNVLPTIISRLRRQFDLGAEPVAIDAALSADPLLAPLVQARPGLRVPGGWDGFEIAVRAILGQQITLTAATKLVTRLVNSLGQDEAEQVAIPGLTHLFPGPECFHVEEIVSLGMPAARAQSLVGVAQAAVADKRLFDPRSDLAATVEHFQQLPGIGEWTAQYIAMRALGESDAFLAGDVALQRQLAADGTRPSAHQVLERAEQWRPWRAYANLHLWMADADAQQPAFVH
ncbi:DNA-3-methyladenine glycosylase 2 family protein [Anatilimnocola sp. NA78]|uniref:DNA-3-methyladenine glycosylase 2 family protein n=1 Tax=Anatilimnocola sp. NA78 TaxID=3415683 RepID=UPI003CE46676